MLKNLTELGIEPIKCPENKNDDLKELQYAINEQIFKHQRFYITHIDGKLLADKLIELGTQIKKLPTQTTASENILNKLRNIVNTLKKYLKELNYDTEDEQKIQNTLNYIVVQYLKKKKNLTLTPKNITHILDDWMHVNNYILMPNLSRFKNLNTKAFYSARKELLELYVKCYAV